MLASNLASRDRQTSGHIKTPSFAISVAFGCPCPSSHIYTTLQRCFNVCIERRSSIGFCVIAKNFETCVEEQSKDQTRKITPQSALPYLLAQNE